MTRRTPSAHPPERAAVVMGGSGEVVSFGELDRRSMQLAQLFRAAGLRPGDHIALVMENGPHYHEVCWAAQRSGLYYTPVNWHLQAAEARYIVEDCGAKALIASAGVAELARGLAGSPTLALRLLCGGAAEDFACYDETIASQPARPLDEEWEGSPMFYSSGTTGRPKGILRPLPGVPFGSGSMVDEILCQQYPFSADTIYLSPAPLYHAAPLGWSMTVQRLGGSVVVMESFDPVLALELIERHRVNMAQFVPTMFIRMLKLPEQERCRHDLTSLKLAVHAAAPCPVPVKEQMLEWWGPVIYEYLGASEGGLVAIGPEEWLAHRGSVGRPEHFRVHIVGDDGSALPPGEIGTICYEGTPEFEYHGDSAKTAETRHPSGWMTVGDVGYVDEEGYLYLTDRKSHMIISGGVNIYPQEIENILIEHPEVADAAVIGVPNPEFGEEVKAVVQPTDMSLAGPHLEGELVAWCRERLAHYKCPRSVDFRSELPRLPTGKLLKRLLKDEYWGQRPSRI